MIDWLVGSSELMHELLRAVVSKIMLQVYWFFAPHLIEKLPKPVRIGCTALGVAIILAFVGFILFALVVKYR